MIKKLNLFELSNAAEVIRESFSTIAEDFSFTEQTFPTFTGFATTTERLQNHANWGLGMYGLHEDNRLIGYVSISKVKNTDCVYELHNLAILPDYRHKGYGKQLLDFCKEKVREFGGEKLNISIIEENIVLKNWYTLNGFIHIGVKKFNHMPIIVGFMEWSTTALYLKDIN